MDSLRRRTRTSGGRDNHNCYNIAILEETLWSWRSRDEGDWIIADMGGLGMATPLKGGRKIINEWEEEIIKNKK